MPNVPKTRSTAPFVSRTGLTYVEWLALITMVATVTAIVLPTLRDRTGRGRAHALTISVEKVQKKIYLHTIEARQAPRVLNATLLGDALPTHPWAPDHPAPIWVDREAGPEARHPSVKAIGAHGCFWYNPANGAFRALVSQEKPDEQLRLYNEVNGVSLRHLSGTR
ncbi:MAG: hypothetical protein AAF488_07205 [Planctomycetota bacterium]